MSRRRRRESRGGPEIVATETTGSPTAPHATERTTADVRPGWGSPSLEVRWIFRGPLPSALIDHLGPFDDAIERRTDSYLVSPGNVELGVKIRDGVQLDLKASRGSPGRLRVPGGEGTLERRVKWTLPLRDPTPEPDAAGWVVLCKERRRRTFELTPSGLVERRLLEEIEAGCTVELTEVDRDGAISWTLAFEATGPTQMTDPCLRACAGMLLGRPLPGGIELTPETSMSYTRWLGLPPAELQPPTTDPGRERR